MSTEQKTTVPRECHICKKAFPYHELERYKKSDWDKFVYLCKSCEANTSPKDIQAMMTSFSDPHDRR